MRDHPARLHCFIDYWVKYLQRKLIMIKALILFFALSFGVGAATVSLSNGGSCVYQSAASDGSGNITYQCGGTAPTLPPSGCSITGNASMQAGGQGVYQVTCAGGNAPTGYTWTGSSGLSVVGGQGSNTATVSAAGTASGGATVSVTASNAAGSAGAALAVNIINGCPALPNVDIVDINPNYNTFSLNRDSYIDAGRVFAGKFTYLGTANSPANVILSLEQGNLGRYGIEQKDIYISKCPGSFAPSDTTGDACYDRASVGSFWIDNAASPLAPYYCHLVAGRTYYVNMRVTNGGTSSYLLGFIRQ